MVIERQVIAFDRALTGTADALLIVEGCPDDGKTMVEVRIAVTLALLGQKIILSCHTNVATDVFVRKVLRVVDELSVEFPVGFLRERIIRQSPETRADHLNRGIEGELYSIIQLEEEERMPEEIDLDLQEVSISRRIEAYCRYNVSLATQIQSS
jgi:hypothetical protein